MSDEPKGDLQFDRADYGQSPPASLTCASCGQAVWGVYYAVNGQVLCERCKTNFDLQVSEGSGVGRFLRATLYGLGAGAVGAGIWYVVLEIGYQIGLIAILVGYMVGWAVRKGSNGRGGGGYQALAMFLTYASIVSTYIPEIVSSLEPTSAARPAVVIAIALAFPFLGGFQNIIGIVIIGIALYEAWKLNRKVPLAVTGPHRVGTPAEAAAPIEPDRG